MLKSTQGIVENGIEVSHGEGWVLVTFKLFGGDEVTMRLKHWEAMDLIVQVSAQLQASLTERRAA